MFSIFSSLHAEQRKILTEIVNLLNEEYISLVGKQWRIIGRRIFPGVAVYAEYLIALELMHNESRV